MTNKEMMLNGDLYMFEDDLGKISLKSRNLLDKINKTKHTNFNKRSKLVKKLFGSTGNNIVLNKPLYCDYGENIHVGENFYSNFNLTILDVNKVVIGNNCLIGPNVSIYTAGHPIDADVRITMLEFGKEINIGNNVWIGGNAVINPGVTIGDNVVIASGAIVTKSFESNLIIGGNPAQVIRKITDEDRVYWNLQRDKYYQLIKK